MSYRNKVWLCILIAIISFNALYWAVPIPDRTFINLLGIIGFLFSVLGIVIAYLQIVSVKAITISVQKEVRENIRLNNDMFMLSELSRNASMVTEIQGYLKDDKIDLCIIRMKDLKVTLNALKNQEYYNGFFVKKEFKTVFEDFNIDLDNFQRHHIDAKNKIDKARVITNLEGLSTVLLGVEVRLKAKKHDS